MRRNYSASMYGGYPSGGRRIFVMNLRVDRFSLRNEIQTDSAPIEAPAPHVGPENDKEKLRGLNYRLNKYLPKVTKLEQTNASLQKQIDEIVAKRQGPKTRDWDEVQKPFHDLRIKIRNITMEKTRLLIDANSSILANDDFKKKLDGEIAAQNVLQKELDKTRYVLEEIKELKESMQKETEMVKDEIDRIKQEHKDVVADLCVKIRASKVKVEIEPGKNNLIAVIDNMRREYEKIADKNWKETEDVYSDMIDKIKVVMAQNTEALKSGNADLKERQKQKQQLELEIQTMKTKIHTLEILVEKTKIDCEKSVDNVKNEVRNKMKAVEAELERQSEKNRILKDDNLKLKEEIQQYNDLMNMCSDERKVEA